MIVDPAAPALNSNRLLLAVHVIFLPLIMVIWAMRIHQPDLVYALVIRVTDRLGVKLPNFLGTFSNHFDAQFPAIHPFDEYKIQS